MVKQTNIIYLALFFILSSLGAEEISFVEYKSLNPEIDLLSGSEAMNGGRKLLLFPQLASFTRTEYAYIYDTAKNTAIKVPSEEAGFFPYTRITYFWDPHTKANYGYVRSSLGNDISGWYTLTLKDNGRLTLSLQSKDEYWAYRSPPRSNISGPRILVSNYSGYLRDRLPEYKYDSKFDIFDIDTNERIWSCSVSHSTSVDLYWISGSWFLKYLTPRIAGIWKTDTIFNYETNEEVSFAPESIIGYGDGVILTSLQTEKDFIGMTVWNMDHEILYCDTNFLITGMLEKLRKNSQGQPTIDFSYYDYPYIYCNVTDAYLFGGGYTTLIMNLIERKTYMSPEGYYLHGIFEFD
jgi:hypothetical protein